MIRVLHVVHTMECGGIETMLMNVYRNIDREKIQFDFLVNGKKENYFTKEIESLGGKVLNVTPKRVNFFKNLKQTIKYMKNEKYEIVHIHQDSMIFPAIWCARRAGIKNIITHAHTTSVDGWYRKLATYIGRKYIKKYATMRYACSNAAADWIYGKKEKNYTVFKNAIDAKKYQYDEVKSLKNRNVLGISEKTLVIGTCGRLSPEKNQKFLIEVFSLIKEKIPNSKLLMIGDGPEKENLLKQAKNLNVNDDIIFTGMVNNTEFYYNVLDVFVLPSFYEGLPLTGVEAQAAGLTCFFSTGVTKEIKVTENVYFISLEEPAKNWCKKIIELKKKRVYTYNDIKHAGYDIGTNVGLLEDKYMSLITEKENK